MQPSSFLQLSQPAAYRVAFQGWTNVDWSDWLRGSSVDIRPSTPDEPAITTLTGTVADQAALFGLLSRLRDLGLPLLLVQYLPAALPASPLSPRSTA